MGDAASRIAHIILWAWGMSLSASCVLGRPPTDVPSAPATPPSAGQANVVSSAPKAGDDPAKIEAYLRGLKDDLETRRRPYADVRLHGTDEELAALNQRMDEARQRFDAERERLWPGETEMNDEVMAVAGSVLTGVGVAGGTIGLIVGLTADDLAAAVVGLGAGVGGGIFVLVGVPLLVAGAIQVPREPSKYTAVPRPVISWRVAPTGVALAGSF